MPLIKKQHLSPSRTILFYMALTICIGTFFLSLPISQNINISLIDVFFTTTSSICVTGLSSVAFDSFTLFGQIIILLLIQVGGLGIIALTFFILSLFFNLGLASHVMAGEMLDFSCWKDIKKTLLFIIGFSFCIELLGTLLIFFCIRSDYSLSKSLFFALFHSISSFCNAGICPFSYGMIKYAHNTPLLLVTSFLMIAGGIGFLTWKDIFLYIKNAYYLKVKRLSLQTKIILFYYFFFVFLGTILFWLLEHHHSLRTLNTPLQWVNAFFISINSRSGGLFSLFPDTMQQASLFTFIISAFIGAAPASTGSGVKLTTIAIFIAIVNAAILGKSKVILYKRSVPKDQIFKAIAIIALTIAWIMTTTLILLITEKTIPFFSILFESVSAFTTLGASLGITPLLSNIGKVLIALSMFIGRIGSLTFLIALKNKKEGHDYSYPEEQIMIT